MNRVLFVLPLWVACSEGAAPDALLLAPDDVEIRWDSAFNDQYDGAVALVAVDVMVYSIGRREGEPVAGVPIQFAVESGQAGFVLPEEVEWVEADPCEDCRFLWDMHMDRGFQWADGSAWGDGGEWAEDNGSFAADDLGLGGDVPSARTVVTDEGGLARVYVFVDAFPLDVDGEAQPVAATLRAPSLHGVPEQRFSLVVR